jgi:hypothetical protein
MGTLTDDPYVSRLITKTCGAAMIRDAACLYDEP